MALSFRDETRIQREVLLGKIPTVEDTSEMETFRARIATEVHEARASGLIIDFVHDYEEEDDVVPMQDAPKSRTMNVTCPHCQTLFDCPPESCGNTGDCPQCGQLIEIRSHRKPAPKKIRTNKKKVIEDILDESPMSESAGTYWGTTPPCIDAELEEIDDFSARGMWCVYGRGDHYGRHHTFHMDIWKTREGRVLMRFWSRCSEIDWRSYEIKGLDPARIPDKETGPAFSESWVPEAVRQAYDDWISEEF